MSQDLKLIDEVSGKLEKSARFAPVCGGTVASAHLRELLHLRRVVDTCIAKWRDALKAHNAQDVKVYEYDIETGEIKWSVNAGWFSLWLALSVVNVVASKDIALASEWYWDWEIKWHTLWGVTDAEF